MADLLLENRVDKWLSSVRSKSEQFLSAHAGELGVDRTEIDLGMAAARLRASLDDLESLEQRTSTVAAEVENINRRDGEQDVVERGDTYHELQEELRESRDTAKRLEVEVRRARGRVKDARTALRALPDLGTDLAALGATELRDWEEAFLDGTDASRRVHRLVALAGEWYLRFGRSRDFFAALIADSEVIAGTCLGFTGVHGIQNVEFDLCVVDEASKATVTELLVPLSRSAQVDSRRRPKTTATICRGRPWAQYIFEGEQPCQRGRRGYTSRCTGRPSAESMCDESRVPAPYG